MVWTALKIVWSWQEDSTLLIFASSKLCLQESQLNWFRKIGKMQESPWSIQAGLVPLNERGTVLFTHLHDRKYVWENRSRFRQVLVKNPRLVLVGGILHQSSQHRQDQSLRWEVSQHLRVEQDVIFVAQAHPGTTIRLCARWRRTRSVLRLAGNTNALVRLTREEREYKRLVSLVATISTCCSVSSDSFSSFVLGTLRDRCDLNKSRPFLLVTSCMVFLDNPRRQRQAWAHTERVNRDAWRRE